MFSPATRLIISKPFEPQSLSQLRRGTLQIITADAVLLAHSVFIVKP